MVWLFVTFFHSFGDVTISGEKLQILTYAMHIWPLKIIGDSILIKISYDLRRNGTPPLFDVLPFKINNENYFLLIGFIRTNFDNFPRSSVG